MNSSQTPLLKSSWHHPLTNASLHMLYFTLLNPAFNSESTEGSSFSGALKIKQNKSYYIHLIQMGKVQQKVPDMMSVIFSGPVTTCM